MSKDNVSFILHELGVADPVKFLASKDEIGLARIKNVVDMLDVDDGSWFSEFNVRRPMRANANISAGDNRPSLISAVENQVAVRFNFTKIKPFLLSAMVNTRLSYGFVSYIMTIAI